MTDNDYRVRMNVGGKIFEMYVSTLRRSSYFKAMFNERWRLSTSSKNEDVFVDRSPELFYHVLELLRSPDYEYPCTKAANDELLFYGIYHENNCRDIVSIADKADYAYRVLTYRQCRRFGCSEKPLGSDFEYCVNCSKFELLDQNRLISGGIVMVYTGDDASLHRYTFGNGQDHKIEMYNKDRKWITDPIGYHSNARCITQHLLPHYYPTDD